MDYTFHPTLVEPFYLHFMNANVLSLQAEERARLVAQFRKTLPLYSSEDLRCMLKSSWRPAKVAAWAIAARCDCSFIPDLADQMAKRSHVEHLCIALATLGGGRASRVLDAYLSSLLPPTGSADPSEESISPDWALAALVFVDPENGRRWLKRGGPWEEFLSTCEPDFAGQWRKRLEMAEKVLPEAVALIKNDLGEPTA